jgi:hypothetical protein
MKNSEILEAVRNAKTAEEVVSIYDSQGKTITIKEAEEYLSLRDGKGGNPSNRELSEDELESIAGGGGVRDGDGDLVLLTPDFTICDRFTRRKSAWWDSCSNCSFQTSAFTCGAVPVINFRSI